MSDGEPPLRQFQAMVQGDPALQAELRQAPDRDAFVALVIARAAERGLALDAVTIDGELEAAARLWTVQWLIR